MTGLRFWRVVTPTPGRILFEFRDWPGPPLRFLSRVSVTPGAVALRFGAAPVLAEDVSGGLDAGLPTPTPPTLGFEASGDTYTPVVVITGDLSATLPTPTPPFSLEALGEIRGPLVDAVGTLDANLSAPSIPTLDLEAVDGTLQARIDAALPTPDAPELIADMTASYDLALPDADGCATRTRAVSGRDGAAWLAAPYQSMIPTQRRAKAGQTQASRRDTRQQAPHRDTLPGTRRTVVPHAETLPRTGALVATATELIRDRLAIRLPQSEAKPNSASVGLTQQERIYTRHRARAGQTDGQRAAQYGTVHHTEGRSVGTRQQARHTDMIPLPVGYAHWTPPPGPPGPPGPDSPVSLRWCRLADGTHALVFGCPGEPEPGTTIVIPIRRVYRVLNTVTLTRVSDGAEIPADGLSLSLDADSWTWSWSARIPGSALSLLVVAGEPQELLATINGEPIRLLIDSISRAREFGSSWLAIRGRGRAAVLAAPTAPSLNRYNTATHTAQQLLVDALTDNGVSIGWSVDWDLEDWSVPAGAWSHTGTYIEAATRLAEAGGGYVQGHDTDQTLLILPYYPIKPWDWPEATPDIAMPEDVCRTEGIEWVEKAGYNAVWVTGGAGGRRDYIRRTGTDGLTMAQTIVDPLATDAIMTRQRGVRILGDTGKQALVTVKLPVVEETGIIRPGNLIEYTEGTTTRRGLSRSVAVECGFPEVWQTIKLEARE